MALTATSAEMSALTVTVPAGTLFGAEGGELAAQGSTVLSQLLCVKGTAAAVAARRAAAKNFMLAMVDFVLEGGL